MPHERRTLSGVLGARPFELLLTCEHGGNRIPAGYRRLFRGARAVLRTHRALDIGALSVARLLRARLGAPLHFSTISRLVIDLNRWERHPRLFSEFMKPLPDEERRKIVARYYAPHHLEVRRSIAEAHARGHGVLHIAIHSFTPVLRGRTRPMDIGLLYDPTRARERTFAARWKDAIRSVDGSLVVHSNAPYRGTSDGLPTVLRNVLSPGSYAGFEIELNQRLLGSPRGARLLARVVLQSLELAGALRQTP